MVKNMRKKIRGEKGTMQKTEAPIMAVRPALKQLEKNAQRNPGEKGLVITMKRRGISSRIALRHLSCTWLHVLSVKPEERLPSET